MHALYLVSVWLHILAAMAWIGGMLFLVSVLVPMLRAEGRREQAAELFHEIGLRFRRIGWAALVTLVVTGTFNLAHRGYGLEHVASGQLFAGSWGRVLLAKLLLVSAILASSAMHDFYVGPLATRLAREGAEPSRRERLRRAASWMGRMTLLLALGVVALGVALVRGLP